MREVWLRANRRAIAFGTIPPLVMTGLGIWMTFGFGSGGGWWQWLGTAVTLLGAGLVAALLLQLRRPRVAHQDGHVLFYLRSGPPIAVPIGVVEAFFLGRGPSLLPGQPAEEDATVNLVARLSRREPQWAQQDVKQALGHWCDGYVTIRGTWCEPLDEELVRRLNRRLKQSATSGQDEYAE